MKPKHAAAAKSAPYRNPRLPVEKRVDDLLGCMTLEEKVGQLVQIDGRHPDILRLVRDMHLGSILCTLDEQVVGPQQAALASRLGIPLLTGIDAIHGHSSEFGATIFPTQLGLACAWDEELCRRVARATAVEMAHTGVHWNFSPLFCLPRDLRWGRTGESFGEDPLLIGRLGAAMVRGYQGDDLSRPDAIAACAKHYAGYGESEGGRDASESDHSRRKMRWLFLPPFQAAIDAGAATVMTAYHAIDGVPCAFNRWLLTDVLRGEWGFDGMVVTDWDIIGRMHRDRRISPTLADGSARALEAGNDMMMTTLGFYEATLENLRTGRVPLAAVDTACRRILRLKFRLGLFENPRLPNAAAAAKVVGCRAHRDLAREAARSSLVLLKNRGDLLPLARANVKRIAVVGPNADHAVEQLGDWSLGSGQGHGKMARHPRAATVTVLDGMRAAAGPGVEVTYAQGCGGTEPELERIPAAVRAAESAELCVLVLGDQLPYIGESRSTATLALQGGQQALFAALAATGVPLVVVLACSKPLAIPEVAARADAILCVYNPGMEGGTAVAEALFGELNPSGKLTISWPHHVGQQPVRYDQIPGAHQAGYPDLPGTGFDALFAFGFGLSYTSFAYSAPRVASARIAKDENVEVEIDVTNTGERAGVEIAQLYLRDVYTSVTWPAKRLKGWQKVALKSGETQTVRFTFAYADLALSDADGAWVVEPGEFEAMVGGSSRDRDLRRVGFCVV